MLKIKQKMRKIISMIIVFSLFFIEVLPLITEAATLSTATSVAGVVVAPINGTDNQRMGSYNKEQNPKVTVNFNTSGTAMVAGSKMTATAAIANFKEDSSKVYYTWYLARAGCGLTKNPDDSHGDDPGDIGKCDLDGDGEITVNDWKIAAARIVVRGDYDNTDADYEASIGAEAAGYEANPSPLNHGDDKGWVINSGDDINDKNAPNCYAQEPKSGIIYELRQVDQSIEACPEGYQRVCAASDQIANCEVLNPDYNEADAVAAQNAINAAIAWNLAHPTDLHVVPPSYAIPKTITKATNKFCAITNDNPVDLEDVYCKITTSNFTTAPYCYDNAMAMCVKYSGVSEVSGNVVAPDTNPVTNPLEAVAFKKGNLCSSFNVNNSPPPSWLSTQNPLYNNVQNQKCEEAQSVFAANDPDTTLKCSAKKAGNTCKHLFAKVPASVGVTGDGKFGKKEKEFWGASPIVSSTNGVGVDEANVVGLGIDKFVWMFTPGDQVGVVVEGESAYPTMHADATFKRMWAFSKNTCKALENLEKMEDATYNSIEGIHNKKRKNMYLEGPGGGTCDLSDVSRCTGFLTAEVDLDECLPENLIDPKTDENATGNSKLSLQITSQPANPINDPNGRGDILDVSAANFNSQDAGNLLYDWFVQISRDGSAPPIDTTAWEDITNEMKTLASFSAADLSGVGKKKLAIKLNLTKELIENQLSDLGSFKDTFYLKIKAKAKGTATDGSQNAEGFIIVKVRFQQNDIKMFSVAANNDAMLSMDDTGVELCASAAEKAKCYVTKDEIIGLSVSNNSGTSALTNFSWTVNGAPVVCDANISEDCILNNSGKVFVPILGNTGEIVEVVMKAIKTNTNEAVEIRRQFLIISPQVLISSGDISTVWPKLLGYYKDLSGNQYPDYSKDVYETAQGATANLVATVYPHSMAESGLEWTIDGETQYDLTGATEVSFPINKLVGSSYDVGLLVKYKKGSDNQVNNIRKALLKNWKIEAQNVIDEKQNVAIQINILDSGAQAIASKNMQSGLASLISHLPENLMFLLKIVLTSGGLLLLTSVVFAVMPGSLSSEEEYQ